MTSASAISLPARPATALRLRQHWGAAFGIVCIAGHNVDRFSLEQPLDHLPRAASPESRNCVGGDLDKAALLHHFQHSLRFAQQNGIAFGMGENGNHSAAGDGEQVLFHAGRNAVVAKLNQQISRLADGVSPRMIEGIANVVIGKVEVTAQAER
jgi:hypothetical protein